MGEYFPRETPITLTEQELTTPFAAKEFPPNRIEITVDKTLEGEPIERNGFVAQVTMELDSRATTHNFVYDFDSSQADESRVYVFQDDFKRAINGQFKNERGKPGGRDDKIFKTNRTDETAAEYKRLNQLLEQTMAYLRKILADNNLPESENDPARLRPVTQNKIIKPREEWDDEGKRRFGKEFFDISWIVTKADGKPLFPGRLESAQKSVWQQSDLSPDQAKQILEDFRQGTLPQKVETAFSQYKEELKEKFAKLPIQILQDNIQKILNELKNYESQEAKVTVVVTGPVK